MTYWYPGVFAAIREVRNVYPKTPIILGGTYATLCYEHALQKSEADYVIKGEGELQALRLAEKLIGSGESQNTEIGIDDYPYPAHDLLTSQNSLAILTSRGCPMGCTYCASRLVAGAFRQRDPLKVADEIEYYVKEYRTSNFAFYDDALLINPDKHILILLDEIIRRELDCCFHTPNAMHASKISRQVAKMMFRAGFKTIRISLETSNDERQRRIGYKISAEGLRIAIENLKEAGYSGKDIGVYVLIGLPGQPLEEMIESVKHVRNCGAITKLAVYSPIPGTEEWKNAVARSDIEPDADPLLHNDSIYPVRSDGITIQDIQQVKALALKYNNAI